LANFRGEKILPHQNWVKTRLQKMQNDESFLEEKHGKIIFFQEEKSMTLIFLLKRIKGHCNIPAQNGLHH